MAGGPHYLLFVILTVHVQHKQVIAQAADGDACNREWLFDTNTTTPGFLHALQNLSQERSNCWSHSEKPASWEAAQQQRTKVSAERLQGARQSAYSWAS